jgi:tetratricopeptide (TPR) repeat protein
MDKHFSDVKDRFYIRYNKNRPKEIREKIQKAYSKLKKDIEEEFIRMVFPNKDIIEKELRDQLITLSELSKKKKGELKPEDEIEFRVIMKNIDGTVKKHKIKLPKIYYSIISEILVKFNRQEEALKIIDPIIKDRAEDLDLMELKFMLLLDLGRYDDAIETVDSGIKLRPDVESIWHSKGILLERMGKNEEAELCYRQGIKFTHTCSSIHLNYGILLYEKNQFENALEQFESAIRKESTDDNYLIWKALASDKLGKREEAIKIVEEAICYNDKNPDAWYVLGKLSEDRTQSIKYFDKALFLDRNHASALCSKGACLSNLNKIDEAMEIFDRMKDICPEYESCNTLLLNISRTLIRNKKFGEALSYVDRALEYNVNDSEALCVKARIVFEDGKKEEAIKIFEKALELNTKSSTVWYDRACVLAQLNRIDEAIESLKKAIELDSSIKIDMKIDSDLDGIRKNEKFIKEFG